MGRRWEPPIQRGRSGQGACREQPQVQHVYWPNLVGQSGPAHAWHRLQVQGGAGGFLLLRRHVRDDQLVLLRTSATTTLSHKEQPWWGREGGLCSMMHLLTPKPYP